MIDPTHPSSRWTLETVPESFWERIADADGDVERYKAGLSALDRDDLHDLLDQFSGLGTALVITNFSRLPQDVREQDPLKTGETADSVISQGKAFYQHIFASPESFPLREQPLFPIYPGQILRVYLGRYGRFPR